MKSFILKEMKIMRKDLIFCSSDFNWNNKIDSYRVFTGEIIAKR